MRTRRAALATSSPTLHRLLVDLGNRAVDLMIRLLARRSDHGSDW